MVIGLGPIELFTAVEEKETKAIITVSTMPLDECWGVG